MENNIKVCQNCGTKNKVTSMFCKSCGNRIADVVPVPAPEPIPAPETATVPESVPNTAPATVTPVTEPTAVPAAEAMPSVAPSTEEFAAATFNATAPETPAKSVTPIAETMPMPNEAPTAADPVPEQSIAAQPLYDDPNYINGLPVESVKEYMGCSSDKLYRKFVKHSSGDSAWNWPVFFFALLGVPFVWFFYRRMYKVGAVILAVWFALTAGCALFNYLTLNQVQDPAVSCLDTSLDLVEKDLRFAAGVSKQGSNNRTVINELNKLAETVFTDPLFYVFAGASALFSISQIVFVFIISNKANRLYFKAMTADIRRLHAEGASLSDIRAAGATNVTAATVSGFLIGGLIQLVAAAPLLIMGIELIPQVITSVQRFMKDLGLKV